MDRTIHRKPQTKGPRIWLMVVVGTVVVSGLVFVTTTGSVFHRQPPAELAAAQKLITARATGAECDAVCAKRDEPQSLRDREDNAKTIKSLKDELQEHKRMEAELENQKADLETRATTAVRSAARSERLLKEARAKLKRKGGAKGTEAGPSDAGEAAAAGKALIVLPSGAKLDKATLKLSKISNDLNPSKKEFRWATKPFQSEYAIATRFNSSKQAVTNDEKKQLQDDREWEEQNDSEQRAANEIFAGEKTRQQRGPFFHCYPLKTMQAGKDGAATTQHMQAVHTGAKHGKEGDLTFMLSQTEFMPDKPPAAKLLDNGLVPIDDDAVAYTVRQTELQFPRECVVSKTWAWMWCPYGTGACFHGMSRPLTVSWIAGLTFVFARKFSFVEGITQVPFCFDRSINCFLEKISNCTLPDLRFVDNYDDEFVGTHLMPGQFQHRGYFWWVSQQMAHFFKPSTMVREMTQHLRDSFADKLGIESHLRPWESFRKRLREKGETLMAMHVRRGDKCRVDEKCCQDLDVYMKHALRMREKYNVRYIYLATDSLKVINHTKKYEDKFVFLYQNISRKHFDTETGFGDSLDECHQQGKCDPIVDTLSVMMDIEIMLEADVFVGAMCTSVFRLLMEIVMGRRGCMPPHISIDSPWCHNGGFLRKDIENTKWDEWKENFC